MFESSVAETYFPYGPKHQTVLATLELPHFIETDFEHSWHCRLTLLFQVQKQSYVKCAAHTLNVGLNCSVTVL